MNCYKLTLQYDGTGYNGWQLQPNAPSIQFYLEKALTQLLNGEAVHVSGSGRTDAGVHAKGQTAHFKTSYPIELKRFLLSVNALLPLDIRVKKIERVSLDFHARYSAIGKIYHYYLYLDRIMDPFQRLYSWHVKRKICLDLLKQGAQCFIGTHDFTSFANEAHKGSAAKNPVRVLHRLDVCLNEEGICLEFEGNGFLYKMVRNIVGVLVDVASQRITIADIQTIFDAKDRKKASQAAPPQGLFLMKVNYPE